MKALLFILSLFMYCAIITSGTAAVDTDVDSVVEIIPEKEKEIAQNLHMEGPTESKGIESSEVLGSISLAGEFVGTEGYKMRARKVVVIPGAQVAVHQHNSRPGVAYILKGELIEHRNDSEEPITRKAGDVAFEKTGTIHWWENKSSSKATVIVVDIVPVTTE